MRIAHIVTYISPDGAFGGPSRVALGQAAALATRGHDVTVYAAAPAALAGERMQDGYTLKTFSARRLLPGGGFAMMRAPQMTGVLRRELPRFDVVHVHLARDLVTLPAARVARRAKIPYVLQTHGMIDASERLLARPLDAFATRPVLRDASAILVLTDQEDRDIRSVERDVHVLRVGNGIEIGNLTDYVGRSDLVLFLARLHERKRPRAFVEMAGLLATQFPHIDFVLVGPDEGEATAILDAIAATGMGDRLRWMGAASPSETDAWISSAKAYVLPAVGEVFPMTILESLRAGTPVVTTDSLGIADACRGYGAALITNGSASELAAAVARVLTDDEGVVEKLRAGGLDYLRTELDISRVAEQLERTYESHVRAVA